MKDYSAKIVNEIKKILDEDDWDYSFENKFGIIITKLDCKEEIKRIDYMINVGDDWYRVSAKASLKADKRDKDAMLALAELTCRANCWLVGGFMGSRYGYRNYKRKLCRQLQGGHSFQGNDKTQHLLSGRSLWRLREGAKGRYLRQSVGKRGSDRS